MTPARTFYSANFFCNTIRKRAARPCCFNAKSAARRPTTAAPPVRSGKAKPWRTIDIHCHCMVPEANAMVQKATGIVGGGHTPNANAHVNELTKSIQPQRCVLR